MSDEERQNILLGIQKLEGKIDHLNSLGEDAKIRLNKLENKFFGNGEMGTVDKVRVLWFTHQETHSDRNKLINFTYRSIIAIGIGYIAVKLGIK